MPEPEIATMHWWEAVEQALRAHINEIELALLELKMKDGQLLSASERAVIEAAIDYQIAVAFDQKDTWSDTKRNLIKIIDALIAAREPTKFGPQEAVEYLNTHPCQAEFSDSDIAAREK